MSEPGKTKPFYDLSKAGDLFEKFIKDFKKSYKDADDKQIHFEAFKNTLRRINEKNAEDTDVTFNINKFSDYTDEEKKRIHGIKRPPRPKPIYDVTKAPLLFEKFMKDYKKTYKDEEDTRKHFEAFKKTLYKINEKNTDNTDVIYDINVTADYTDEELDKMRGAKKPKLVRTKPVYDMDEAEELFEKFIKDYAKTYKGVEDKKKHFEAFKRTLQKINEKNAQNTFLTFDINVTSDYTEDEKKNLMKPMKTKPYYDINKAQELFEKFIKDYKKTYKDAKDKKIYFEAFKKTIEMINEKNAESKDVVFDINRFADFTEDESSQMVGFRKPEKSKPFYDVNKAEELFERFIKDYEKSYKDEEDRRLHFEAFKNTLNRINEKNSEDNDCTFDINVFSDYTEEEISKMKGLKKSFKPKPIYDIDDAEELFEKFIIDYNKTYTDSEDKMEHFEAFKMTLNKINAKNSEDTDVTFDINMFADYTDEEMSKMRGLKKRDPNDEKPGPCKC